MSSVSVKSLGVAVALSLCPWLVSTAQDADPGQAAAAAMRDVAEALEQNRPADVWDALPPVQQHGVQKLIERCAAKLDADSWRHGFTTIERMGLVLTNKQDLVRGSRLALSLLAISSEDRSAAPWFRIGPLLTQLGKSAISDPAQLGKLDVQRFLSREGRAISANLADLSQATRGSQDELVALRTRLTSTTITPARVEDGRVLLRFESPGNPTEEHWFTSSGGKWMPESLLRDWSAHMANGEAQCEQLAQGGSATQWLKTLGDARAGFDQLANAEDQPQFDAGMSSVASAVGPQLAQMALDSMLGGTSIGGVQLNVGNIIYTPEQPAAKAPNGEAKADP